MYVQERQLLGKDDGCWCGESGDLSGVVIFQLCSFQRFRFKIFILFFFQMRNSLNQND